MKQSDPKLRIYGAGMAGLLAAQVLRNNTPVIMEAAKELPNNHAALLRFRSNEVAKATQIHFKKVRVSKAVQHGNILHRHSTIRQRNMYAQKVSGKVHDRSIGNLESCDRYIAPPDFISKLSNGLQIEFDQSFDESTAEFLRDNGIPAISTIPMPIMMDLVGWEKKPAFLWKPIRSFQYKINVPSTDVYQTIYYPDKFAEQYRVSITGDTLIIEVIDPAEDLRFSMAEALFILGHDFGITDAKVELIKDQKQKFGKLLPIDENIRKEFILYLSDSFGIYSLGRFATWRQLLLDDILNDIHVIDGFITQRGGYTRQLHNNARSK